MIGARTADVGRHWEMVHAKQSDRRLFLGSALLLLGRTGMWVSAISIGATFIAVDPFQNRLWIIVSCSLVLTLIAGRVLRTPSLIWQIALQSCAVAGLVIGITVLFKGFDSGWDYVFGRSGAIGLVAIVIGVASAFAMRRLQSRIQE